MGRNLSPKGSDLLGAWEHTSNTEGVTSAKEYPVRIDGDAVFNFFHT